MKYLVLGLGAFSVTFSALGAPEVNYSECQPVFEYRGSRYLGTTDKNNDGSQWCYLTQAKEGSNWGHVRIASIPKQKTLAGGECAHYSDFEGERVYGCKTHEGVPSCKTATGEVAACEDKAQADVLAHTLPEDNQLLTRVAVGSCFKTQGSTSAAMSRVINHNPDLFLWLGDNIYGDTQDMSVMRDKYDDKKRHPDYHKFLDANIPVMATWDDHDFGRNNDGKHYPKRSESQLEFLRHFDVPSTDVRYQGQEGIYNAKMLGPQGKQVHVIMLDARYFRSPTFDSYGACEGDKSTVLGQAQWQWLEQELKKPSELKIIATGIQVLPPLYQDRNKEEYCAYTANAEAAIARLGESEMSGTRFESWAEIPLERERLLRLVQKTVNQGKAGQVVFVSGDQHWGEMMQKTLTADQDAGPAVTVYEVTASGFGQHWPYTVPNGNRLPVWADTKGDGNYNKQCVFPYKYALVTYDRCITRDHDRPWCYTQVDDNGTGVKGEWGNCASDGAAIPTGRVGVVTDKVSRLSTSDRHIINRSGSNYGLIDIDWDRKELTLSIETEDKTAVSTVVKW